MKNFRYKKILITGGLGFIGSNLAIKLVNLGASVEIYDALIKNFGGNTFNIEPVKDNLKITIADLRETLKTEKSVKNKDFIFNLAGNLSHIDSMKDPFMDTDINCRAQLQLLEACKKNNPKVKIVFAGTRNQYGKAKYLPVDENHPQGPTDINGVNAIAGEKYHFMYSSVYGLKVVSLRMSNTFGPRHQMKHSKQGVLNWFVRQLMDGKKVLLFGGGSQIRDVNYIDDVIEALIAACATKANGKAYNLGGSPISLLDFVQKAIKILGRGRWATLPFPKERKNIEIGDYIANIGKIKKELGWKPKTSLDEGIVKTVDYYKQFQKHYW